MKALSKFLIAATAAILLIAVPDPLPFIDEFVAVVLAIRYGWQATG